MIGSKEPSLNADGTRIALTSNGSLAFDAPSSLNIYLFDTTTSAFTGVSNTQLIFTSSPLSTPPALVSLLLTTLFRREEDGTRIAYRSDINLTGGNADGNQEIFLARCSSSSSSETVGSDLDGDGRWDVIFRETSGLVGACLVNGTSVTAVGIISNPGMTWQVVGAGDLDGDTQWDIVLRHTSGAAGVFLMNGLTVEATRIPGVLAAGTEVVGMR